MDAIYGSAKRRFVLLRHELPENAVRASHWDLMLESDGRLLTWELSTLPIATVTTTFQSLGIRRLADHRLLYLDFEGHISGDRGYVRREDAGFVKQKMTGSREGYVDTALVGQHYLIELRLPSSTLVTNAREVGKTELESCEVVRFDRQESNLDW